MHIPIWILILSIILIIAAIILVFLVSDMYFGEKEAKLREALKQSFQQCYIYLTFKDERSADISWDVRISYTRPYNEEEINITEEEQLWRRTLVLGNFNPEEEEQFNIKELRDYMHTFHKYTNIVLSVH